MRFLTLISSVTFSPSLGALSKARSPLYDQVCSADSET